MERRNPLIRDLRSVGSSEAKKLLAARVMGGAEMAAAIDIDSLPPAARIAVREAVQNAGAASLLAPAAGDMMCFGCTIELTATAPLGANVNIFNDNVAVNLGVLTRWGLDDSEKVDVPILVTRLSFHVSSYDASGVDIDPLDTITLRNSIVHGNWILSAGETGEVVIAKGAIADHLDVEAIGEYHAEWIADPGEFKTKTSGLAIHQDMDERPWQGGSVIPAGYPLRMLLTGAQGLAAITPGAGVEALLTCSIQGIRIGR